MLLVLIQMMDNQITIIPFINLKNFNIIISKKDITKLAKEEVRKNSCQINSYLSMKERLKNQRKEEIMKKRIKDIQDI